MLDEYGKEIEYDINDWHGEDFTIANPNFSDKEELTENDSTGTLIVSLGDFNIENIDIIELSLIDDKYNIKDFYLYKNNGFNEAISLNVGQYEVLSVLDMTTAKSLTTNNNRFTIKKNESEYIKLVYLGNENVENEETNESTTIINKEIKYSDVNYLGIVLNVLLVFVIVMSIILFLKRRNGKE